ncbi:hypothetical protein PCANC_06488 [Puccinia coronata f. sp. avenae]|uniref:Uncharacterized protein n=1 Tax=Puccinia coronata f. sp. avenae TaxID=200324 RepID=A0A2N5VVX8_9BASI|nr:hypothetical protein PCANC_06488 [Puccinia coronata f. sp. avenae]
MSSSSHSNRDEQQPTIAYQFPDPTNPEHFRPPINSLVESANSEVSSRMSTSGETDTDWSILSLQNHVVEPSSRNGSQQDQPASNNPDPSASNDHQDAPPATTEAAGPQAIPDSPKFKCQDWIDKLPSIDHELGISMTLDHATHASGNLSQGAPSTSDEDPLDPTIDPNEILHSSIYTSELGPGDRPSVDSPNPAAASTTSIASAPTNPTQNENAPSSFSGHSSSRPSARALDPPATPPREPSTGTPQSSVAQAPPIKKSSRYPSTPLLLLLFVIVTVLPLLYWQNDLKQFFAQKSPLGMFTYGANPAQSLSQGANRLGHERLVFEYPQPDNGDIIAEARSFLALSSPARLISRDPSPEPNQVIAVDSPHIHYSPPASDTQPKKIPVDPHPQDSPENATDSRLIDDSFVTRRDEIALEDRIMDVNQTRPSPTDDHIPQSNPIFAILCVALVAYIFYRLFQQEPEPLNAEELISGLDSGTLKDCPRSTQRLQASLTHISMDEEELKKLSNKLKANLRAGKSLPHVRAVNSLPQVKMGLLAWAEGALGNKKESRERWTGFWNAIHPSDTQSDTKHTDTKSQPPPLPSQDLLLSFVKHLGAAFQDANHAGSSTTTGKPPKPDPDASTRRRSVARPEEKPAGLKAKSGSPEDATPRGPDPVAKRGRKSAPGRKTARHAEPSGSTVVIKQEPEADSGLAQASDDSDASDASGASDDDGNRSDQTYRPPSSRTKKPAAAPSQPRRTSARLSLPPTSGPRRSTSASTVSPSSSSPASRTRAKARRTDHTS